MNLNNPKIKECHREAAREILVQYLSVEALAEILARRFPAPPDGVHCECANWCRAGQPLTDEHHINCKHYRPAPADPRHAVFGKLMWEMIAKMGGDFCGNEWSEDVLTLAEKAGLCARVKYDPDKHGYIDEAEPGSEIWWWGESHEKPQSTSPSEALV